MESIYLVKYCEWKWENCYLKWLSNEEKTSLSQNNSQFPDLWVCFNLFFFSAGFKHPLPDPLTEREGPEPCVAETKNLQKAPKLTSSHHQLYVLFDVVEPTRDFYAAAVCTCIFYRHFPYRERHISIGNIALKIVPLRFSECHPIPSGVQNFVIALWIWAWASSPAHIRDVLRSCHLVEARQSDRLSYYSSNNSFRCGVHCQGRRKTSEGFWWSQTWDCLCSTTWQEKKHHCLQAAHFLWSYRLSLGACSSWWPQATWASTRSLQALAFCCCCRAECSSPSQLL